MLDRISLVVTIVGAINWLLVGLFQFDLVAYICGGQAAVISRVIYGRSNVLLYSIFSSQLSSYWFFRFTINIFF